MAGVLDEFDEPTPLKGTFCSRLTAEQYEEQGSTCTEQSLSRLCTHLDKNPGVYKQILSKKKKQDKEDAGFLSFMKVKLYTLLSLEDSSTRVSDGECKQQLDKLKTDMVKAFDYSQEAKGRRFSKRLAEKRLRSQQKKTIPAPPAPPPPAPPFPPPPPPAMPIPPPPPLPTKPGVHAKLTRRPLTARKPPRKVRKKDVTVSESKPRSKVLQQLKGSECRKRLRKTANKSPGGTPQSPIHGGRPKRRYDPNSSDLPYFNTKLVDKFWNTQQEDGSSPVGLSLASPGAFESPL